MIAGDHDDIRIRRQQPWQASIHLLDDGGLARQIAILAGGIRPLDMKEIEVVTVLGMLLVGLEQAVNVRRRVGHIHAEQPR